LILILGVILIPFMWLGSPQDFSLVAFAAMTCTAISCILVAILFIGEANQTNFAKTVHEFVNHDVKSVFLSLGTIIFAYGGAATFPTFQNDMRDKTKFPAAVTVGFLMLLLLYLPIAFGGYALYGKSVAPNVLVNIPDGTLITIINILMAFHVLCAFLIVINPVNLTFEEHLNIPRTFTWKRVVLRTLVAILIIITGLSVPKFGKILNLVGGSTVALTTFILPPIFYVCLISQRNDNWIEKPLSLSTAIAVVTIVLIGVIGGVASSYSSLADIFDANAFTEPCFSQLFGCRNCMTIYI